MLSDRGASRRALPRELDALSQRHTRASDLHAAALVQVLSDRVSDGPTQYLDPLDALLLHERIYWQRALRAQADAGFREVDHHLSDTILVVPTLCPTADAHSAEATISRVLRQGETLPCSAEHLARVLAQLYPGEDGRYWSPMPAPRLLSSLTPEAYAAVQEKRLLVITKANARSTVHRNV